MVTGHGVLFERPLGLWDDALSAAHGVVYGVVLGAEMWLVLGVVAYTVL